MIWYTMKVLLGLFYNIYYIFDGILVVFTGTFMCTDYDDFFVDLFVYETVIVS